MVQEDRRGGHNEVCRDCGQFSTAMVTNLHMLDFLDTVVLGDEGGVW